MVLTLHQLLTLFENEQLTFNQVADQARLIELPVLHVDGDETWYDNEDNLFSVVDSYHMRGVVTDVQRERLARLYRGLFTSV